MSKTFGFEAGARAREFFRTRGPAGLAAVALAAVLILASGPACQDPPPAGETPAQQAAKELRTGLLLPAGAELIKQQVFADQDFMYLEYSLNADRQEISEYVRSKLREKGFRVQMEAGDNSAIGYKDDQKRTVTMVWFERDAEVVGYQSLIRVMVKPLPKEIQQDPNL